MSKLKELYKDGIITKEAYRKILCLEFDRLRNQYNHIHGKMELITDELRELREEDKGE